ncbi:zf-HC2 domain-containing protein [Actinomycetospora cinnamomea]|uniref:Uncharacterized protein n=1 Tax=Actinomycetospora cinnamomea TaxID=663609 RepID=A0A2U1F8S9_9PSEU|nr:zf-HC2 domain-containing protein [Actinomycetospora cinnamomea]PVZ08566.1 hypothetical protein C8D89_108163 [Actinomycetospora cinnamomea]
MIAGRGGSGWSRRFTDAGHLALDAVVAFVDDELPPGPAHRAAAHVDRCLSCAGEVAAQRQARRRVRTAECPSVPSGLLTALRSIPDAAPLPEPPAGLSVDSDGSLVVPVGAPDGSADARRRRRGRRRGFGVPVAVGSGVVVGAAALVAITGPAVVAGGSSNGAPAGASVRPSSTAAATDLTVRRDGGAAPVAPVSAGAPAPTPAPTPTPAPAPASGPALHGPGAP